MKNNHTLQNQRGAALFEIVVGMAILVLVLTSMIITMTYAQYKSITNYHDRIVLLKADAEMQKIKYRYESTQNFGPLTPVEFDIKDKSSAKPIRVRIIFSAVPTSDNTTGLGVTFTAINAKATWEEHRSIIKLNSYKGQKRTIVLREDYYVDGA